MSTNEKPVIPVKKCCICGGTIFDALDCHIIPNWNGPEPAIAHTSCKNTMLRILSGAMDVKEDETKTKELD